MGVTCSAYGGEEWGNRKERDHLGEPGLGRKMILRWVFRKGLWDGG